MKKTFKYTNVKRIIGLIKDQYPSQSISESRMIEQIGHCIEELKLKACYEERVAFVTVKNHKAQLPSNITALIQIAKNIAYKEDCSIKDLDLCPKQIEEKLDLDFCSCEIKEESSSGCKNCQKKICTTDKQVVFMNGYGEIVEDFDKRRYGPFFHLRYGFALWNQTNWYKTDFVVVRPTSNTMFNSISEKPDIYININKSYEYSIVEQDQLLFNFENGQVAISYLSFETDEDGYPLIPDSIEVVNAIVAYVTYKLCISDFLNKREGSQSILAWAEKESDYRMRVAKNSEILTIDTLENIKNISMSFLPNPNAYANFFKDINKPSTRYGN